MPLIDLDALRAAQLNTDPFDFLVVPDFLSPDTLAQVNADYPAVQSAANHALESLSYGPAFGALMAAIQDVDFATVLGERFGMDLASLPSTVTVRKFCERTDGNIHTETGTLNFPCIDRQHCCPGRQVSATDAGLRRNTFPGRAATYGPLCRSALNPG